MEVLRNFEPRKVLPQNSGVFQKINTCTHFCAKRLKFYYTFHEVYLGTLKRRIQLKILLKKVQGLDYDHAKNRLSRGTVTGSKVAWQV